MRIRYFIVPILLLVPSAKADFPKFEAQEIDARAGEVVYAATTADVNGDAKPDVVAATEDAVLWYENPSWTKHIITKGKTERDNVCIQAHDIDGDGKIDFALGAGWHPGSTTQPSTLQWLGRDARGEWQVHPITYTEPTLHRFRFGDVLGNGKTQLVVAPLQGRGTKGPNWGEGSGVKVQVFSIPSDPTAPDWPSEVADDSLHTTHSLQIVGRDLKATDRDRDRNAPDVILIAGWEGVFTLSRAPDGTWKRAQVGTGNQESKPFKGASEVKLGRRAKGVPYVATIEPWHGTQVVAYVPEFSEGRILPTMKMARHVLAEPVAWGHAVWCADLDGDGDDEIIIGQRDANKDGSNAPKGPGIFAESPKLAFTRHTIDDGGMACEDALCADLDGDGKPEIIAGGRSTHNVKIYWNKGKAE